MGRIGCFECPTCGSALDRWSFCLMVYEDDLERIAHEEAVHYHIIGFSSCVRCISMDEDPSVRAIFDIDVEDWLQARAFGLTVITVRRNA